MGLTWGQIDYGAKVVEERKAKGEYVHCPGCDKRQQESFFDTLGIEHCSECHEAWGFCNPFERLPWGDDDD